MPKRTPKRGAPDGSADSASPSPVKAAKLDSGASTSSASKGKAAISPGWSQPEKSLLVYLPSADSVNMSSKKVAAFDMDGTLIATKSGKTFAVNESDWKIYPPQTIPRLKQLHSEGYKLVILSNQHGIAKGKTDVGAFKKKVEQVQAALGVSMIGLFATDKSEFRKPCVGKHFSNYHDSIALN